MTQPPSFLVSMPQQVEATDGDIVTFQIRVTGQPDPVVTWYRCGEPVGQVTGRWDLVKHEDGWHELLVSNLNIEDEGEYECRAQNEYGMASCFGDLYYYGSDHALKHGYEEMHRMDEDVDGGRQSGLMILLDDGSQTEDDSNDDDDDPSRRRSLTASEQMQGIIEDLTSEDSLTLGRDEFGSNDPSEQTLLFEGWHHSNTNPATPPHLQTMSEGRYYPLGSPRMTAVSPDCFSCPVSDMSSWYPQSGHDNSYGELSSENISSISTLEGDQVVAGEASPDPCGERRASQGEKRLKCWDIVEEEEDQMVPQIAAHRVAAAESSGVNQPPEMSYSRSTSSYKSSSSSYKYSEGISDDSFKSTSISSTGARTSRLDRLDSSDLLTSSSLRRATGRTSIDDDDSTFRRSSRTSSALDEDDFSSRRLLRRFDDEDDSGVSSIRRTTRLSSRDEDDIGSSLRRTTRLSSRDEDDTASSLRRTTRLSSRDEDDTASSLRRTTRLSSRDDDDLGSSSLRRSLQTRLSTDDDSPTKRVSSTSSASHEDETEEGRNVRRAFKSSTLEEEDEGYKFRKSKLQSSLDAEDESSSLSVRANRSDSSFEGEEGGMKVKSSRNVLSYSESFSSEAKALKSGGGDIYEAILDFQPLPSDKDAIPLKEGQEVEVIDDSSKPRRWLVRTHPFQDAPGGVEGWVPSCYLEKKTVSRLTATEVTKEYTDPKEKEAASKRAAVVKELVETEEDFSRDMQYVVRNYLKEMNSTSMAPQLRDYKDALFANFKEISEFHNNELIRGVQYYANEPAKLGVTFLRLERDFDKHSSYCKNEPDAQALLASTPLKAHFEEVSKRIGDDKTLPDHLKLPIQRINDYQLLLKELIKYTARLGEDTTDLDRALEFMQTIPQRAADSQLLKSIQGYKGNIHKFGRVLKHDWFDVMEGSESKERYVFLFKGRMCVTEVKKGQTKENYTLKNIFKLHQVTVKEESDDTLTLNHATEAGFPLTLKARSIEQKERWLKELTTTAIPHASEAEAAKPRFIKPIRGLNLALGETGSFECEIAGATNVSWLKGTQPVKTSARLTVVVNGNHHSLVFKDLKQEDAALYTVVAANDSGTASTSAPLDVKGGLGVPKADSRPTTPGGSTAPHAPVFKVMLKDTELLEGTSVRFEIVVRGHPDPTVMFLKNGEVLKQDERVRVLTESKEAFELVMDHVVTEDAGKYSCEAKNTEGQAVTEGNITVTKHKVLFQGLEDELEPVKTPSPVPPVFKWFKDGSEFEASERFQVSFDDSEDTLALVFHHVKPEDAGLYTCVASTCSGRIACSAELTVQGLVNELMREPEFPEIKAKLQDVEVSEGASAMMEVKVSGFPKPALTWYHEDDVIEAGGRYKFLFEDNESISLVVKNVTKADAGVYRVVAKNELGEAASSAHMTVTCPPSFRKPLKDVSVMTDEPVKMQVEVDGQPEPEIKWYKDGQPVSDGGRIKLTHPRGEIFALSIDKAKIEDAGNYSCVVTNPIGSQTGFGNLFINSPPSFVRGLKSTEVAEEDTATLSVKVAGTPKPTIKWAKDGKEIKETKRIKIIEEETNTYSLIIEKITREDAGKYSCDIKNEHGSDSSSGNLGVKGKPSFTKKLTDMEFREGDSEVTLDVKVDGLPKPTIKWLKDEKAIKEDSNLKIKSDDETGCYSLVVKNVTSDVGGSYTCQATNSAGTASTSGTVSVNAAAKIVEGLKDTKGALDQDASFTVKFKGHPKPDVKWTKDGASLTIDNKHVTVKEEASDQLTLIIHQLVDGDKGKYGCEVSNQFGKDTSSGSLTIQAGKPVFIKTLEDREVREGDTNIDLEVKVEGTPEPTIKWSLNGKAVSDSDSVKLTSDSATGSHKLTLKKVEPSAAGLYKCTATNNQGTADTSATFTVLSKPKFTQGLKDADVNEGQSISLTVKVEGNPVPDISWRHNGEEASAEATIRIKKESDFVHLIEIDNATISLSGDYECKATSSLGEATTKCKINVNSKPIFEKGLKDKEVWTEEETVFEVKVKGCPEPEIKWLKYGKAISKSERIKIVSEESTHKLTITKTKMEDSATYKVVAKNKAGEATTEALLSVQSADDSEAPTFIRKMVDTIAVEGDAARFEVKVAGKPAPTVTWYKEEEEVTASKTVILGSDDNTFTLTLRDLVIKDTAQFSCKAVNEKGEATNQAKLTVKEPVAPGIEGMTDLEVKKDSAAKFEISTTGLPKPQVKWLKDGSSVKASDSIVITSDDETQIYSLTIRSVKEDDLGTYACQATNSAGKAEEKAKLGQKPEAPTVLKDLKDVTAKPGDSVKFEVRFGGYPVPKVSWFKGETALDDGSHYKITEKGDCFFLEVVGVTSDDLATYTCRAKNSAGEASSTAVLRQQDSAPVIEQALPKKTPVVEGEQLKLEAKVGGQPEPDIKWLKDGKELKPDDRTHMDKTPEGVTSLQVDDVKPADAGKYELVAKNDQGQAKSPSTVSVQPADKKSKPEFVHPLEPLSLTEGQPGKLEIKAVGNPRPQVTWLKNGETIDPDGRLKVEESPDGSVALVIQSPTPEDAGKYTCIATNDAGDATTAAPVTVQRPPTKKPEFAAGLKPTTLVEGKPGRLEAKVSGEPKPNVKWLKDGKELSPNEHVSLIEEPDGTVALLLDKVTPEDAGKYAVVVSNDQGEAKSQAPVTVDPSSPAGSRGQKPGFDQPLLPGLFTEGEPGRLEAKVTGEPKPEVKWLKDGKPLEPSDNISMEQQPDGTVALNINKVTPEDSGKYSVQVSSPAGENKSDAKVTTIPKITSPTGKKPEFDRGLTPCDIKEAEPLKLEAKVSADPKPDIKWLKDGEELPPSNRIYQSQEPDGTVRLTIDHALPEDSGKYAVVATNPEGKTRSAGLVNVKAVPKEKPSISVALEPATLTAGQPGKLTAKFTGRPKPVLKWLKDGKEVTPDNRVKIVDDPDGGTTLLIDSVVPEDAGKYTVVAANENGETRTSAPVAVNQPPIFEKPLSSADAVEGYPSKLEGLLTGEPKPEVKWLKDGKNFKPDGVHVKSFHSPEGPLGLIFDRCIPQDSANYGCVASNPHGEASTDGDLNVKAPEVVEPQCAPTVLTPLSDVSVKEGEPIKFQTEVSGSPLPGLEWYLDDQPVHPSDNIHMTFDGKKATLDIRKCNPQHAGQYECRATNALGTTSSKASAKVLERSAPRFIQKLVDMEAPSSEPLRLQCRVRGSPEPEIEWYFNGSLIEPGLKYNMAHEGDTCTLTLPHPRSKDSGRYECKAKNSAGEDRCAAEIKVSDKGEKGSPPMFLKKLGDCESSEGSDAKFTACIAGSPMPDIKWFRNGEQVEFGPRQKMELEPNGLLRLYIRNIHPEDFGEYRLSISNPYGSDQCTGHLRTESLDDKHRRPVGDQYPDFDKFKKSGAPVPLPDKPRIIRMLDDNLTLGWKPSIPIYPRVPVTYQLEHMKLPDGPWSPYRTGIKDSICDVRGLEPGRDYRYRVRVENKFGVSDPSPYVTAHRTKIWTPPTPGDFKPKDYEIEHPPLEKNAEAPRFLRKEEDTMYGVKGQPVSIEFWVYGYPQPDVTWFFNNQKMEKGKYDFLQDRNGQVMVFITRMTEADVGTYVCHAVNEHGEAKQKINLLIAEAPVFIKKLEETNIMIRRSGHLECRVLGKPYPKVKWFKDWHPLHESSRIKITWTEPDLCSLYLSGSIAKDTGLYSCSATNIAGTASTSAMVSIEESESEYDLLSYTRPKMVKPRTKPFEDFYDIGDELGRGTQGIAYHAVERQTGKSYAAKVMHGTGPFKDFMTAEMDIMNQLCHPNLVRLWDAFETKKSLSLVTDLCGGGELLDHIINKGSLTESEVAHYIKQVLTGLEHMHNKNIGHLGLTVGDVLVTRVNGDTVKLSDFGLAARLHPGRNYIQLYGHPEFVAPELVKKQPASLAADMWSVGVLTYLLLSGVSPFLGEHDRETLTRVQEGKINFFHDGFAEVSDDARDFISKLLVFDPTGRLDVKGALTHPWLRFADVPDKGDSLNNIDRLKDYYKRWKDWYANASCRRYYRRRPMESCFTHPSKMIYPPNEVYSPPETPERDIDRTRVKPAAFDDTYQQKIAREPIDFRSESQYQSGPDTYLLQLRDTDFPMRIRQYLRVGASRSPSLASNLKEKHWGASNVAVHERRRFVEVMDEEIDDEQKGLGTRSMPLRLQREIGTLGYTHEQIEAAKREAWKNKSEDRALAIGAAPFFRERIVDVVIKEDQEAVFSCMATGNPEPAYSWFRNDGILVISSRIQVKPTPEGRCQLHLKPGKMYDTGVYKCVARNSHGVAVCRARLKIGDVPGRPDAPEVSRSSDREMYVVWASPRSTGNSHILGYWLEFKQADKDEWSKVADNIQHEFFVVKNLEPNTGYQFRITAINKFGNSPVSNPCELSSTMPEGAPKISISRARKFQQAATERGQEITDDTPEDLDYSLEKTPVELKPSAEVTDYYNFVSEITRGRCSMFVKTWVKEQAGTFVGKLVLTDERNEAAVKREVEVMRTLCHQYVVRLETASFHDSLTVLILERLSGVDILTYLASKHTYNEETVAKVIQQVLEGLDYLHFRGICYLELQPDNVVLVTQRRLQIKLVDFGSAHFVPKAGAKVDFKGTTEYLAPEIIKKEEVSAASDVWGVAVLTYILLSGVSPFCGENEEETANNVSYVRYRFENLHKEVTQEATRFLMHIFKRTPSKRPTIEECLEHKWLLPSEFLLKKREHAVFLAHRLHDFSEQFHSQKQGSTPQKLTNMFGMSFTRSISLENDTFEEV